MAGPSDWIDGVLARRGLARPPSRRPGCRRICCSKATGAPAAATRSAAGSRPADATALFVGNDQMALGILRAFNEAGVRVPDDVSVVGFDDQPESGYFSPPLTTVRQDFEELGRRCLDIMLKEIEAGAAVSSTVVTPELVSRGSTAAPGAGRDNGAGCGPGGVGASKTDEKVPCKCIQLRRPHQ